MPSSSTLYPLKFTPIIKDKLWGGSKLKEFLNKKASDVAGEAWEVSGIAGSESSVSNGPLAEQTLTQLISTFSDQLLGHKVFERYGYEFPLLIKYIHANEDLSIQVHPSDEQSGGNGKTEMWYVIQADQGATLLSGFKKEIGCDMLRDAIDQGTFEQFMNRIPVEAGDTFFIPANQVHTIGGGLLIAEIQQSSDITYRIYDFDRIDLKGKKREVHVEQAFNVMNISTETGKIDYIKGAELSQLVSCPEFVTNKYVFSAARQFQTSQDKFKIYLNVSGEAEVIFDQMALSFHRGETIFLPAGLAMSVRPKGTCEILETFVGVR
jgi:mannose-6-phosphate isomerase